jgi:hypothetical protein
MAFTTDFRRHAMPIEHDASLAMPMRARYERYA